MAYPRGFDRALANDVLTMRADLVAVRRDENGLPEVETVWCGGRGVYAFAHRVRSTRPIVPVYSGRQ